MKRLMPGPAPPETHRRTIAKSARKIARRSRSGARGDDRAGSLTGRSPGDFEDRDDGENQKELRQDEDRARLADVVEQERRDPREKREGVDREDRERPRHAEARQPVGEMVRISLEDRSPVPEPDEDDARGVEERYGEDRHRHEVGVEHVMRFVERERDREARKPEADEKASRVAQKNPRRREVEKEECRARPEERNQERSDGALSRLDRDDEKRPARKKRHAAREPVHVVEQVEGVRDGQNPEDRHRHADRKRNFEQPETRAAERDAGRDDRLHEELERGREFATVVDQSQEEDRQRAERIDRDGNALLEGGRRREEMPDRKPRRRKKNGRGDGEPPSVGDRLRVDLARPGMVEEVHPARDPHDERYKGDGDGERGGEKRGERPDHFPRAPLMSAFMSRTDFSTAFSHGSPLYASFSHAKMIPREELTIAPKPSLLKQGARSAAVAPCAP